MKAIKIGSFDAKTHFSELLRDVEKGTCFEILRRGKPVAQLTSLHGIAQPEKGRDALGYFRALRRTKSVSMADIKIWIKEGRP